LGLNNNSSSSGDSPPNYFFKGKYKTLYNSSCKASAQIIINKKEENIRQGGAKNRKGSASR